MLDEKLENLLHMNFMCINENIYAKNTVFDINYNYLNDMILVFFTSKIYQMNFKTKEIVTIYDISKHIQENLAEANYSLISFYNYNEKNKKLEQIMVIIDKLANKFFQFKWNEKILSLKKNLFIRK